MSEHGILVEFIWNGPNRPWSKADEKHGLLKGCWLAALPAVDDTIFVPHYTGEVARAVVEDCVLLPYGGARIWVSDYEAALREESANDQA